MNTTRSATSSSFRPTPLASSESDPSEGGSTAPMIHGAGHATEAHHGAP
jgi:hypothetical protein